MYKILLQVPKGSKFSSLFDLEKTRSRSTDLSLRIALT